MTSSRPIPPTSRNSFLCLETNSPAFFAASALFFAPFDAACAAAAASPALCAARYAAAYCCFFFCTSGRWDCWLQAADSPAKPFGTAPPRWPEPPPAPRGIPPARVSACGPPANFEACGFRSGQPFPCRAPSGVPPPRRHFPAPPHAPSHGRVADLLQRPRQRIHRLMERG